MSIQIVAFAKFGSKEFMEDLLENGTIFLNTVNAFKKMEDNYRGDKDEGVSDIIQAEYAEMELQLPPALGGKTIRLDKNNGLVGPITISDKDYTNTNIYSLYMIYADESFKADERVLQFGDYFVMIHKPEEFMNRMNKALEDSGYRYSYGSVKYINKNEYQGSMNIFNKFSDYSYQNEYRYHVINNEDKPIILNLGCLKDIAQLLPSEAIKYLTIKHAK